MPSQLECNCGSYCYKVVLPLLDHLKALKQKAEEKDQSLEQRLLKKLASLEKKIDKAENKNNITDLELREKLTKVERKIDLQTEYLKKIIQQLATPRKDPFVKIGHRYFYFDNESSVNWFDARNRCREIGGHLLLDNESFHFIRDHIKQSTYWIDKINEEGQDYYLRVKNEESSFETRDAPSNDEYHFICERDTITDDDIDALLNL